MSSFKPKSIKPKLTAEKKTLGELHKDNMEKMSLEEKLEYLSRAGELMVDYFDLTLGSYYDIESSQNNYTESINDTSVEISSDLKELNELSKKNRKVKKQPKKRRILLETNNQTSIFDYFAMEDSKDEVGTEKEIEEEKPKINISVLNDIYRNLLDIDQDYTKIKIQKIVYCANCNKEKILMLSEGCLICSECGEREGIIMENENPGHRDVINDKQKYPYKRINHFKEKLNQFQSKETANVPDNVYGIIYEELRRKNICYESLTMANIRAILKNNSLTQYYEHIFQIFCKITGSPPITFSRELEEKMTNMFQSMQPSFISHCPKNRSNFLNYAYVLNKLLKILGKEKESQLFTLLKNKDKLRDQDAVWKKICADMKWKYHPS